MNHACDTGHDLKGALSLAYCNVAGLHLPMLCLVDYLGFRVVAMTRLPLRPGAAPAYGSNDGGNTVHNSDPELSRKMETAATQLNLCKHVAG